ncbi:MAG: hypothetical protein AAF413_04010 [Patescibacteria group bacterium]
MGSIILTVLFFIGLAILAVAPVFYIGIMILIAYRSWKHTKTLLPPNPVWLRRLQIANILAAVISPIVYGLAVLFLIGIAGCENGCTEVTPGYILGLFGWFLFAGLALGTIVHFGLRHAYSYRAPKALSKRADSWPDKRLLVRATIWAFGLSLAALCAVIVGQLLNFSRSRIHPQLTAEDVTLYVLAFISAIFIYLLILTMSSHLRSKLPRMINTGIILIPLAYMLVAAVFSGYDLATNYGHTALRGLQLERIEVDDSGSKYLYLQDFSRPFEVFRCNPDGCSGPTGDVIEIDESDVGKLVTIFAKRQRSGDYTLVDCSECYLRYTLE